MEYRFDDAGRRAAGYPDDAHDCVIRAVALVADVPYVDVMNDALAICAFAIPTSRGVSCPVKTGLFDRELLKLMRRYGFSRTSLPVVDGRRQTLLDLPTSGRYIVHVPAHFTSVIDGVVHDVYDIRVGRRRIAYACWHRGRKATKAVS